MTESGLRKLIQVHNARNQLPPREVWKDLRTRHRLSQNDCAEFVGVTQQSFSRWEHGKKGYGPRPEHLPRLVHLMELLQEDEALVAA